MSRAKRSPGRLPARVLACLGLGALAGAATSGTVDVPWPRHIIDATSQGADGVRLGDLDGDGRPDIATGWEEGGVVRVYLHPGREAVRNPWPVITVGSVGAPEDAVFADLDGDGRAEVVSASEGEVRGIHIHWAPVDGTDGSDGWTTRALPAAAGLRWMYVLPMDVDGRHGMDLVVGSKNDGAMIGWLEAPRDPRDAPAWKLHKLVDAGWIMSLEAQDMDRDGDLDVIASDRFGDRRGVKWLENPGPASNRQGLGWQVHAIGAAGREVMFIDVLDLDADGRVEVLTAVKPAEVILLRQGASPSGAWTASPIRLEGLRIGTAKAVKAGDLDLDGHPDMVLTFEHASEGKSGVVWTGVPARGDVPSGPLRDVSGEAGTKFDLAALIDLDDDGDLDVLTSEETERLGVVWYENPIR